MRPSEIFEGENSSLRMTFDNAAIDNRCNQCKLENNVGICDRNDCSNKPMNTKSKEQLLAIISKQEEYIEYLEKYIPRMRVSDDGVNFYEQMLTGETGRALREEIQKMKS